MQNGVTDIYDDGPEPSAFPLPPSPIECQGPPLHQQQPQPSDDAHLVPAGSGSSENDTVLGLNSPINKIKKTTEFIHGLRGATLEHSNMQQDDIDWLRAADLDPCLDIGDKHFVKSLGGFLSSTNASQSTYNKWHDLLLDCYPDDPFLSFDQMKRCRDGKVQFRTMVRT